MSLFSKILTFLKKDKEVFDKKDQLLVFSIYSDRIVVLLLEKMYSGKETGIAILNLIEEPLEESFSPENFNFSKLKLNCAKIKERLFLEKIKTKNVVFAFGPEFGKSVFLSKTFTRVDKEQKISKEELDKMIFDIKSENSKKGNFILYEEVGRILVDGYLIQSPVGVHGKEVKISASSISSEVDLTRKFKELASFLKLNYKGSFALSLAFFHTIKSKKNINDAVLINIFENKTIIFFAQDGFIDGIDALDIGYGELDKKISETFSVGREEARIIKGKFISGDLDVNVLDKVRLISQESSETLLSRVKTSLASLDGVDLLPPEVFVAFSSDVPVQFTQVFKKGNNWFSDLPFSKNIEVVFLNSDDFVSEDILDEKGLIKASKNLYTYVIINYLNNHILQITK